MRLISETVFLISLLSLIGLMGTTFVELGDYPDFKGISINADECGLRWIPTVLVISYDSHCFKNSYPNLTLWDYHGQKIKPKSDQNSNRVIGGRMAHFDEAPWAVYITTYYFLGAVMWCNGVLISYEWIVTAGHCLDQQKPGKPVTSAKVWAGDKYLYNGNAILVNAPHKIFIHPNYTYAPDNRTKEQNDIGLVKVKEKFSQGVNNELRFYYLNPICLPKKTGVNVHKDWSRFFSWGNIEGDYFSKNLMRSDIELKPGANCNNINVLCSRPYHPQDARLCPTDSGGGLVQYIQQDTRAVLLGPMVASRPEPTRLLDCSNVNYQYFIPVSMHIDWILKTIANN